MSPADKLQQHALYLIHWQQKVTKITTYKEHTLYVWCVYICIQWTLVKYSRTIILISQMDKGAQGSYLSKAVQGVHDKPGVKLTFLRKVQVTIATIKLAFFPYDISLSIVKCLTKILGLHFTHRRTDVLCQITHNCPQNQWNISELEILLHALLNRPQQPCGLCKRCCYKGIVNLHNPAYFKHKWADSS